MSRIQTVITSREKEILRLISYDYTANEIAIRLFISPHTVIAHRKNLMSKLDVRKQAGLVRRGFEMGVLQ